MSETLQIALNRAPLGQLLFDGATDQYGLNYHQAWLDSGGYPISPHLKPDAAHPESVRRFLANLLPEGRWLDELSLNRRISKTNIFGLVAAIGVETTGALTFQPGAEVAPSIPTSFRPVPPEELTERINRRQDVSIALWDAKPRLSVAGVQDKLPVLIMPDGRMGFGEGDLASTHILKIGSKPEMHLVINEYLCMELARRMKLPVAEVRLTRLGEPVLVVKRFDRQWAKEGLVNRLHLIDGCQMLDLPPIYKYERPFGKGGDAAVIRSGANLPALFAACARCKVPAAAARDLLNWVLFQLLICNSDAHAKNLSCFVGAGGITIAPAYDLLCLEMYGGQYDRDLALAVGDTFDPDKIQPYQLAEMGEACRLPQRQMARALGTMARKMVRLLVGFTIDEELTGDERMFVDELVTRLRNNANRYLGYAEELPGVVI
jgi:serine/threonine-protein kinase HipA